MDTPDTRAAFDAEALLAALDTKRCADGISWRELARRAGIGSYGIAGKLRRGVQPTAGVLILLMRYLKQTDITAYETPRVEQTAPAA